jgi:hypothetical protein
MHWKSLGLTPDKFALCILFNTHTNSYIEKSIGRRFMIQFSVERSSRGSTFPGVIA